MHGWMNLHSKQDSRITKGDYCSPQFATLSWVPELFRTDRLYCLPVPEHIHLGRAEREATEYLHANMHRLPYSDTLKCQMRATE